MDHTPVIEVNNTVFITSIQSNYSELLAIMEPNVYRAKSFRMTASTVGQLIQPIVYEQRNANGNFRQQVINSQLALKQFQNTITKDIENLNVVFDGKNSLNINVLPRQSIQLIIETEEYRRDEVLDRFEQKISEGLN